MTMKLYKAVDRLDGEVSMFLVYPSGEVAVSYWGPWGDEKARRARTMQAKYLRDPAVCFNDAIDPVLIAEW